jgi:hypothetical protein
MFRKLLYENNLFNYIFISLQKHIVIILKYKTNRKKYLKLMKILKFPINLENRLKYNENT